MSATETEYRCVVADPPWTYALGGSWKEARGRSRPQNHYDTMSVGEIGSIVVPSAKQAHLYLWAVTPHVDDAFTVARAWGFEPVTMFTWAKPVLGVGRFRCNTEHVVVARKGSRHGNPFGTGGRNAQATAGTWFSWPRTKHSRKPDEFFHMVEGLSPGPRLEMFARELRLGWDSAGHGVGTSINFEREQAPVSRRTK